MQAAGGLAAFIDAEHALDPDYAQALGVDLDNLYVSQPDTGEQALEITDTLVRSGAIDLIVIDSVAALVPRAEIEGEMGDSHVGLQARLMSQALRKMAGALSSTHTSAIFINQLREKIGVMFGSPETTTGGKALKFYSSVRLDVRRIETLKGGTEAVGNRTRVKVVKNKVAPPFKQAEFDILYGEGISREGSLIDLGVDTGLVKKSGAWYTYEGDQLGQGKENARIFLKDNPDLSDEIEKRIKEAMGIGPRVDAPAPSEISDRRGCRCHGCRAASLSRLPTDLRRIDDPESVVRAIVLRRLSAAPRTRAELETDLARRGADPRASAAVLDRFEEVGLIDDAAFANLWVESRHRGKALARSVLRQELRQRGVDSQVIDEAIEAIDEDDEWLTRPGIRPAQVRIKAGEDPRKAMQRLAGQLARKGYPAGMCFTVAREVLAGALEQRHDDPIDELGAGVILEDFRRR